MQRAPRHMMVRLCGRPAASQCDVAIDGVRARQSEPARRTDTVRHDTIDAHENSRVSGEGILAQLRRAGAAGEVVVQRRRSAARSRSGSAAARSSSRRRSTRAGAARAAASRSSKNADEAERGRRDDARHDARHAPDRARGPAGRRACSIEEGLQIERELYLGHRASTAPRERPVLMASPEGGVEIEKVARRDAGADLQGVHPPGVGLAPFQARKLAFALGPRGPQVGKARRS